MAKLAESIYADQLIKLGFEKMTRPTSLESNKRTYKIVSEDSPSKFSAPSHTIRAKKPPFFLMVDGFIEMTMATDETGQDWVCSGKCVDLTAIGFTPMLESRPLQ